MARTRPTVVHEDDCAPERWDGAEHDGLSWRTLLSGDRTQTDALTVGVAEIAPGESGPLRLHAHDPAEVYYVLAGHGMVEVGGTTHALRPGTCVYIPGGAEHAARNTGEETLRLLYVFAVDAFPDVVYRFAERG